MHNNCTVCGDTYEKPLHMSRLQFKERKYCSQACYRSTRRSGDYTELPTTKDCLYCKGEYNKHANYSFRQWKQSKYCSQSCAMKYKTQVLGVGSSTAFVKGENLNEKHPLWKGEDAHIKAKHSWVKRHKGKAQQCSVCEKTNEYHTIDWANIDHNYRRVLEDYVPMCRSCHRHYDILFNGYRI